MASEHRFSRGSAVAACAMAAAIGLGVGLSSAARAQTAPGYNIFVSNEKSGDVTVIDGSSFKVLGTIAVGKRPRGIHSNAAGTMVYVAVSGTPIEAPPQLDAHGNPIFNKGKDDDDDDDAAADKAADGIAILDVKQGKMVGKISVGSDPEEFALSLAGTEVYVSNEDVKTASVVNLATGKVEHIIPVGQEPEGVGHSPDGSSFVVTCEAGGDIYAIDSKSFATLAHFTVPVRPRSIDYLPGAEHVAFIPSESSGLLNVIDTDHYTVLKSITLPSGSRPMRVRVAPDAQRVYTSNGRAGTVSVLDSHSYALLATIKVGTRPWGMTLSPDGKYLFTANGPSNDVSVVDLHSNTEIARVPAGMSPWGVEIVPTGR